jgi:hypothetical protein
VKKVEVRVSSLFSRRVVFSFHHHLPSLFDVLLSLALAFPRFLTLSVAQSREEKEKALISRDGQVQVLSLRTDSEVVTEVVS